MSEDLINSTLLFRKGPLSSLRVGKLPEDLDPFLPYM
jgi:hypothetical protein